MTYPIYRKAPSPDLLCQGDILDSECLRNYLRGHQDYFADRPHFYRYMILTQTCDLARSKDRADFIFLAVVRKLTDAIGIRQIEEKDKTRNLLRDLYNHNYNKRGYFYLPRDINHGIYKDSVADLRVMFSLHKVAYPRLLKARIGAITDVYAAQLGHMAGYMFSRIATPGWDELNQGNTLKEQINSTLNTFEEMEKGKLRVLLAAAQETCSVSECLNKAKTYRWLRVSLSDDESISQEFVLCEEHAKQHDELSTKNATIRSEAIRDSSQNVKQG